MKHYRLLFMAVLLTLVGRTLADNLSVANVEINAGETKQVAIVLNNPDHQYAAFQFDLVLPEGVSIAKNEKGKLIASLNEDRKDDHTLTVTDVGSNTYRFLSFSMTNAEYYGTGGALVNVTLQAASGISAGSKTVTIKSQVFTEVSGTQYTWGDTTFTMAVGGGGSGPDVPEPPVAGDDMLTVETVSMSAGETKQVALELKNPDHQYAAFQFDLVLPEGMSIAKNEKGKFIASLNDDRKDDHTLTVTDVGSNTYRFLSFSMTNAEYYGKSGALVYVTLQAAEGISEGVKTATIQSQVFTEVIGTQHNWDDKSFQITIEAPIVPVTVTAKSYTREYGDTNPAFEYTTEGATLNGTPEITCEATATSSVGTYSIVIKKGSVTNSSDTYVNGTLTITKAPLTISGGTYTMKQGEALPTFVATYSGFKNGETEAVLTKKPTLATIATSASAPGTYDVTVSGAEAKNYDIKYVKGTLTITAADPITVTVKSVSREYGDANPTFEYTVEGGTLDGNPEISCAATQKSDVGTYDITIAKGTVKNYNVSFVSGKLTVTKAPLTISGGTYTMKQGDALPTFKASYSGFKNGETEAVLTKKPTLASTATSSSAPGTYDVTVSGAEAKNYDIKYVKGTLTITDADPITVTVKSVSREYGDANPTLEYIVEGGTLEGTPEISCAATTKSDVGTYDITIAKGTVKNYNVTYVSGKLTITKASLTISGGTYSMKQGDALPTFRATYSGFKNGETESVLTKKPTLASTATSSSTPGTYDVTVSGAEAKNYDIKYVKGTLTITAADPITVTVKSVSREYGDANPSFEYTVQGGTLDGTPEISCTATAKSDVGTYDITLAKGTVKNYNVTFVSGKLTITKASLTISGGNYSMKQGDALPTFKASYSGFKNGETEAVLTKKPTLKTTATSSSAPGTYDVTVSGAEAKNYNIEYRNGTLIISNANAILSPIATSIAEGSTIQSFNSLSLSFASAMKVQNSSGITLTNTLNNSTQTLIATTNGNVVTLTATTPINEDGQFVIKIPALAFVDNEGNGNKEWTFTFDVYVARNTLNQFVAIPEPGIIRSLNDTIAIVYREVVKIDKEIYYGILYKDGSAFYQMDISLSKDKKTVYFTQSHGDITDKGIYTLAIKEKTIHNEYYGNSALDRYNATINLIYEVGDPAEAVVVTAKSYTRIYGEPNPAFEYMSSGATLYGTPEITCEATAKSPVGTYPIIIKKGGVTNYNDSYVNGTLTITKAPLTISAGDYTMMQGEALPTFKAKYSGFKNKETDAVLTKKPTLKTTATSSSEPGTYKVTVSGAEAKNYEISYKDGTLTIEGAPQFQVAFYNYAYLPDVGFETPVVDEALNEFVLYIQVGAQATGIYADESKVVRIAKFDDNSTIRTGYFAPCSAEGFANLYKMYHPKEDVPENVQAIRFVPEYPIRLGDLRRGYYSLVIEEGTFGDANFGRYLKGDKTVKAEDCIVNQKIVLTQLVDNEEALPKYPSVEVLYHAKELLKKKGLGYPTATSPARIALQELVDGCDSGKYDDTPYVSAIEAFYKETEVEKPAAGKYYTIAGVTSNNKVAYLHYDGTYVTLTTDAQKATGFETVVDNNGDYLFRAADGKYLQTLVSSIDYSGTTKANVSQNVTEANPQLVTRLGDITNVDSKNTMGLFSIYGSIGEGKSGYWLVDVSTATIQTPSSTLTSFDFKLTNGFRFAEVSKPVVPVIMAEDKTREYGEDNPPFTYTSTTELTGIPELSTSATKTSSVGAYDIVVNRGTIDGVYVEDKGTLTITKAPLTISCGEYSMKQGDPLPTFVATYSGFKNGETEAVLTKKPTLTTTATSASVPGTYEVTVSGAEAGNYEISYQKGMLTIVDADAVIVTAKNYTRVYGDANPAFEYEVSGATLEGLPEISCEATATSPVGTYPIVIKKGDVTNYNDTYVSGTLTITKAPLTIKAGTYTRKQGEEDPEFTLNYEGFKNGETEAVLTKKPTVTTTATPSSEPGTYEVKLSGAEAENYEISYVAGTLTITEADPVTVTAKNYTREYGEANPTFEYEVSGAALEGQPEISCEATATSPVGTYPIVIKKGGVTNYNDTYVNGTLTIMKAPLKVTVADATREQGEENPEFVITYEGWKNGETEAVLTKKPVASTSATKDSAAGEYDIVVSGGEAQNYALSYVNGKLTVTVPSGIREIINGGAFDVYTTDGRMVKKGVTTLKGLAKGVYIVNGRKVMVK